jgi:hypothetical protein
MACERNREGGKEHRVGGGGVGECKGVMVRGDGQKSKEEKVGR